MNLWDSVLSRLEARLDPHTFNTWLRPTTLAWQDDTALHVSVPNDVFRDWLRDNYSGHKIRDLRAYLFEKGFTRGRDVLSEKTVQTLRYAHDHYFMIEVKPTLPAK